MEKKKRLSVYSREFWLERGYSVEQADYERNSRRPIRPEYWEKKGFSREEAEQKATECKTNNNRKGAKSNASRPKEEIRKSSKRCVEYWIDRGHTEEEAKKKVSERQSTFSLEKCIEKYGLEKGTEVWSQRQNKWQNSLNKLSDTEKKSIKIKKNIFIQKDNETWEQFCKRLAKRKNILIFETVEQFEDYHKNKILNSTYHLYSTVDWYFSKYVKNYQLEILKKYCSENDLRSLLSIYFRNSTEEIFVSSYGSMCRRHANFMLRSASEIYFYDEWMSKIGLELKVDCRYPQSRMRYDFLLPNGDYIEICPDYNYNEKYRQKMDKKKALFGCVLLKSKKQIDEYINQYYENNIKNSS